MTIKELEKDTGTLSNPSKFPSHDPVELCILHVGEYIPPLTGIAFTAH